MHPLRTYQHAACLQAITQRSKHPLLVAPTGSGKTTMGVYIAQALAAHDVIWLAHRTELIDQTVERFAAHGITASVIKSGVRPTPGATVRVASVQTLARRTDTRCGVVIIDEAHHAAAATYQKSMPAGAVRIGLTATPFRTDGQGLGDIFGVLIPAATTAELVANGTLMDPEVWIVNPPDMSRVAVRMGEYQQSETAALNNTPERRADVVQQWIKRLHGLRTLAFACNVEHSRMLVAEFCRFGVPAEHVDGDTAADDRKAAIARLASGKTMVLSNCSLFTEGFDLPSIEAIVDCAPTASLGRHMQKIGRVMRRATGKNKAIVNDHAGNHLRLGRVTQPLVYSLDSAPTPALSESLGLSHCHVCFRLYSGSECPSCGVARLPRESETLKLDGDGDMKLLGEQDRREAAFNRICQECDAWGHKEGWIFHQFKQEFGDWPATARIDGALVYVNPETADMEIKKAFYRTQLQMCVDKGWKEGAASHRYKELFGVWPKGFVEEVKAELGVVQQKDEAKELEELWN